MSRGEWAIRAEGVSKKFGLTLGQSMRYGLRDVASRVLGRDSASGSLREGEFWAVRDASFDLYEGEALGIMGVNGCGKTTLLRILNGVYSPDAGRVRIRGRVGALIAAGAGFAPMLSGRENIYVNGALLGLSTREVDGLLDEIVAFAELDQFIDLPVRNYSSGMYVRLGFAVAAMSRPDVLLMDEVLAVGDMNFQKKCFDHILQLKRQGTAIILVSHSPGAIWSVCDRGLFMDRGRVLLDGSAEDVIRAYEDQNARNALAAGEQFARAVEAHADSVLAEADASKSSDVADTETPLPNVYGHSSGGTGDAVVLAVRLLRQSDGRQTSELDFREQFLIEADIEVRRSLEDVLLRFTIDAAQYRYIVTLDSYEQAYPLERLDPGRYRLTVRVATQNLRPGSYALNPSIGCRNLGVHVFFWHGAARFVIRHPSDRFLYSEPNAVVHLDCAFDVQPVEAGRDE